MILTDHPTHPKYLLAWLHWYMLSNIWQVSLATRQEAFRVQGRASDLRALHQGIINTQPLCCFTAGLVKKPKMSTSTTLVTLDMAPCKEFCSAQVTFVCAGGALKDESSQLPRVLCVPDAGVCARTSPLYLSALIGQHSLNHCVTPVFLHFLHYHDVSHQRSASTHPCLPCHLTTQLQTEHSCHFSPASSLSIEETCSPAKKLHSITQH